MPEARLQERYPRLPDYQALLRTSDPDGKFVNEYLRG